MKIKDLNSKEFRSVEWLSSAKRIRLIDQRKLPFQISFVEIGSVQEAAYSIKNMIVRGAPAIGATAAYGMVLALEEIQKYAKKERKMELKKRFHLMLKARPTAVDLKNFAQKVYDTGLANDFSPEAALEEANKLVEDMVKECEQIGIVGEKIIEDNDTILTHCNAGALATIDFGTALAPIRKAHRKGKSITVFVDETRPRLQGARLTAWELAEEGINHYIITDTAAGFFMARGEIKKIIVGADRCFQDGSIINKIGTLQLAILSNYFDIPFYTAFPSSTLDLEMPMNNSQVIEFRNEEEIKTIKQLDREIIVTNPTSKVINPAFDLTPSNLITGYITPKGILCLSELKAWITKQK